MHKSLFNRKEKKDEVHKKDKLFVHYIYNKNLCFESVENTELKDNLKKSIRKLV